jgi:hypothetical protein
MTANERFPIRSYGDEFFVGRCANGSQALLGLLCPNVVLYRFDSDGNLVGREVRPWNYPAERHGGVYAIYDPVFIARLAEQITGWQSELGFTEDRIDVAAFYDEELGVGIELPENDECAFVFWWAKDYWMNDQGGVEST